MIGHHAVSQHPKTTETLIHTHEHPERLPLFIPKGKSPINHPGALYDTTQALIPDQSSRSAIFSFACPHSSWSNPHANKGFIISLAPFNSELGFYSQKIELPEASTQEELLKVVRDLNANAEPKIHRILVQSPPPKHIDEATVINTIDPQKDVDGFHPENVAKLVLEVPTGFAPCTPAGCMKQLKASGYDLNGTEAVVIGRSMIVGKPMAMLLLARNTNATVTMAHSRTKDLPVVCRRADVVITAVGRPEMVKEAWIKLGAVVINVVINRIPDS